ncbi:MAG: asparagine synthetase B, partial [bacterium]
MLAALGLVWASAAARADAKLLVPMDLAQENHLKAYGFAYWCLTQGTNVEWLLNYRGGAFLMEDAEFLRRKAILLRVTTESVSSGDEASIRSTIEEENMEAVLLEKPPRVAIYTPPDKQPWDDAVTLALTYAEIPYDTIWDEDVLAGRLSDYDWLHLHHEDFTGQYGKFFAAFGATEWYRRQVAENEAMARRYGYAKVSELKKAVVAALKMYVAEGGFLFAMCSATDTIDIALAATGIDIVAAEYD